MNKIKLKLIFVTQEEPFYIPRYMDTILGKLGEEVEVMKIYALPPNISNKSFLRTIKDLYAYFGILIFSYMILLKVMYKICDLATPFIKLDRYFHSVQLVCRKFSIPFLKISKLNSDDTINEICNLKPDIIFSVACPQIFGKKIISIPSKGCLNVHSSMLPNFRGMNANFWVLAKGEKTSGVTVHYITPGIDDGDILLQKEIQIQDDWSLHDLYLKAIDVGSGIIAKCIKNIFNDNIVTTKNDIAKGSYYKFPTGKDVREFRNRNKRFFKYY